MENLNPLYNYLPGHAPLILGDRSLSTYGRRSLKGLRSYYSKWPLPGVYLTTEIATKFLQKNSKLKVQASKLELFAYVASVRNDQELQVIYDDFENALKLRKLLDYSQAAEIISQGELTEKSQGILYTLLLLKKCADEHNKNAHLFDFLQDATNEIDDLLKRGEELRIDFHVAKKIDEFVILGFRELYPLEQKLILLLERAYKKTLLKTQLKEVANAQDFLIPTESCEISKVKQVLWASSLKAPGPLEAQILNHSESPIRLSVSSAIRYYSTEIDKIKSEWPQKSDWLETLIKGSSTDTEQALFERILKEKSPSSISMLESLGAFQGSILNLQQKERALPLSKSPSDTLLLSLEDLPLINPEQAALWTKPDELKEIISDFCSQLDPFKSFKELEKFLLAEGIAVPRLEEEQKAFEKHFQSFLPQFKILREKPRPEWKTRPLLELKAQEISQKLSPSGLEALYKCSLLFHFSRELRLDQFEVDDALDVSPMRRGNWIHYTLESLPWSNPRAITQTLIKKTLIDKLPKAFNEKASESYLRLVAAQITPMAEALYHYVLAVDLALYENFPARKSEAEKEISTQWGEVTLRGRVDRLDFVGDGALLWDYKSGNYSNARLAKHLENGKFQWLLYREIFRKEGTPIHGGGYINPLDLKKSRLFFFKEAPLRESFFESLEQNQVPYERITSEEETQLQDMLNEKVKSLIGVWKSKIRTGKPRESKDCDYCAYVGRCGYPYGVAP
ncbi:MAG: PD-(D/E)XK nuclease family protein [Bdellovibrionota bacterium]